jgi:DNA (cytosine-5)-methyltransferase 1
VANPVNILSLYSGSGMHDEAVRAGLRVLGYDSRVLAYVEREASAAAWLMGRMEAAALESAHLFCGDLCDLDARPLRGHVDIVVASPPCQPYSSAGKRAGNADERSHGDGDGPLPHTIRIIDECRPALVWLENVCEWVTGGAFQRFGDELSRVGYAIEEPIFIAAEDIGATHQRERVFILAVADRDSTGPTVNDGGEREITGGRRLLRPSDRGRELAECIGSGQQAVTHERIAPVATDGRSELGDAGCEPSQRDGGTILGAETQGDRQRFEDGGGTERPESANAIVGDAGGEGREGAEWGGAPPDTRASARRSTGESVGDVPMFPPGRNDYARWAELVTRGLDPAQMPCVERGLPALVDGLAIANPDLLRLGGNGVVPLAAAVAFVEAVRRATA